MDKVLQVKNLTKSYQNNTILNDISFEINSGEIIGLIGRNGAGKTTLMKSILGLINIDSGKILFQGHEQYQQNKTLMNSIGYLLDCKLFEYLNAYDNILIQQKYNNTNLQSDELKKQIESALNFVELKNDKKKVHDYSFGMKQRLGLALALIGETKLLILDEPFVGLDPIGIEKFREFINKISEERETSILISSHQLSEIQNMCKKYLFISNNKIEQYINSRLKKVYLKISKFTDIFNEQIKNISEVDINNDIISFTDKNDNLNKIMYLIYNQNIKILDINIVKSEINDLFYEKGDLNEKFN